MSTEAEVAMLMLRLLVDKPKELQKVLEYLHSEVLLQKAILEVGKTEAPSREEIMSEFEEKYGLIVEFTDDKPENEPESIRTDNSSGWLIGLPSGAKYKVG